MSTILTTMRGLAVVYGVFYGAPPAESLFVVGVGGASRARAQGAASAGPGAENSGG